jgi:7-cyano-7-deazaguanine reductase
MSDKTFATPEQSALGKATTYESEYNPGLLFPIPRLAKREEIGVTGNLPFSVWISGTVTSYRG